MQERPSETKILNFNRRTNNIPGNPADTNIPPMYNNDNGGGGNMNDKYVTKEYLNAKIETIDTKIDALSKHIDDKFEQIPNVIENSILKEREFQREQQKETRRFFWGTIIIGGISAVAGVASVIVSLILR
ncbi:hypothetical protein LMC00_00515 [Limosilactobacillus reuteri]|uniref:hypothetical protein n=1 Tax=Limosilactobacillus TaxID=2742598 RepID=UPI00129B395C|nr:MULTISPECIES: hypothetical protein [Limosilactobacillus]MCC4394455.1 hypothetical protein [Limosilactobacillus reuteri]MCC4400519.1 hypothetical protein [Limosilactobacillus reuteri]MCD7124018.1 hypothetical protein [Limosilactobacillus caviae]MRH46859.1 hypothetical protein [Limosilactobacillus reuteri]NFB10386.1 hypothetical protein [Limosilactobacillus reuteri]